MGKGYPDIRIQKILGYPDAKKYPDVRMQKHVISIEVNSMRIFFKHPDIRILSPDIRISSLDIRISTLDIRLLHNISFAHHL